jgi:DNA-binding beta-propeller fold protein YncE
MSHLQKLISFLFLFSILIAPAVAQQPQNGRAPQVVKQEGVAVSFSIEPLASNRDLMEATEARVEFKVTETSGGKPLPNLHPMAWIDARQTGRVPEAQECRAKIQDFIQANFSRKAVIDLNSYFILALNNEPNISVIDPLMNVGTTKLYTLIALESPGDDWVMTRDRKRLYVSMPAVNKVAVVDIASWKVIANVDAGPKPGRVSLQNDERYLWVGNDAAEGASGVIVIDTEKLKVAANITTGAGAHEIAFSEDDHFAFVTNKDDGTLSVVDIRKLAKVVDLKVGLRPASLAYSTLGKAIYVANEGSGEVVVVDALRHRVLTQIKTQPGLQVVRFVPDGRVGFAINKLRSTVSVFDLSTNQLLHTVPVGPAPSQITFTKEFAYVRSDESEFVTMIKLSDLNGKGEVVLSRFPSGQRAPGNSLQSLADTIVPAPEAGAVLSANPADKMIYYYTEGMAAPMGSFQNYRRDPRAILVLDNSLRETSPGVYTTTMDSPRIINCFQLTVDENPAVPKESVVPIKVELLNDKAVKVGEKYQLRFRVVDAITNKPRSDLKDFGVLIFLAPGIWQQRDTAKLTGDGIYELTFTPPEAGVYYTYVQVPSLGVKYNETFPFQLHATKN